jgi:hypothetical protein
MSREKSGGLLLSIAALFCAVIITRTASGQLAAEEYEARSLEGSWKVQVTQVNCQTGAALGSPFLSLATFSSGGTMVETTSNPMFYPAVRGPGHGVWTHDHQGFKALSIAFITLNGLLSKTQVITQTIEIGTDRDSFTTTSASVALVPEGGGAIITGCATATGKRIQIAAKE